MTGDGIPRAFCLPLRLPSSQANPNRRLPRDEAGWQCRGKKLL